MGVDRAAPVIQAERETPAGLLGALGAAAGAAKRSVTMSVIAPSPEAGNDAPSAWRTHDRPAGAACPSWARCWPPCTDAPCDSGVAGYGARSRRALPPPSAPAERTP